MAITAMRDAVLDLVPRGERGTPGTPGDYDYATIGDAAAQAIPVIRQTLRTGGYYNANDNGGGPYARSATEPTHPAKFVDALGNWWELNDPYPNLRQFGCKGDNAFDDTTHIQDAWDYGQIKSRMIQVPKGNFLTGPTYLNGRAWVTAGKPEAGAQPSVRGVIGQGMILFGATFIAKAGAYAAGEAVITGRNFTYKTISGIHIDAANIAPVGLDLEWRGSFNGVPGASAPSCDNVLRDVVVERATLMGINIDQFVADSNVMSVAYRGGTPPVGISCKLPGGALALTDVKCVSGVVETCCQNATFTGCLFAAGFRITDASLGVMVINGSQFFANPLTGFCFEGLTQVGSTSGGVLFIGCDWVGGSTHTFYFSGRFGVGCKFIANVFEKPTTTFFNAAGITAVNAAPASFDFLHCLFRGGTADPATMQFPASVPGKINVSTMSCVRPDGILVTTRAFAGDILVGDGRISADKFQATGTGMFGRGQTTSAPPADSYFGMGYNRSGSLGETEITGRGGVFRWTSFDGATFTTRLTFNIATGFYPGNDNVNSLGLPGQRFSVVYAGTGAINTSDARLKTPVRKLTDKQIAIGLALAQEVGAFEFNDGHRTHIGLTVQRAEEIFNEFDEDPWQYGIMCHDKHDAYETKYPDVFDEDGKLISAGYVEQHPAVDLYGFRMDELNSLMIGAIVASHSNLHARLKVVEDKLSKALN